MTATVTDADIQNLLRASYANLQNKTTAQSSKRKSKGSTRFRSAKTPEEFDAIQRKAVEQKGIVAPNLNGASVEVVDVLRHDFAGTGKQAIEKAKEWAENEYLDKNGNPIAQTGVDGNGNKFNYNIDKSSISKFLSSSSTKDSDNLGVHLAVLKYLPKIIINSILSETHPDYKKIDKRRSAENGVSNESLLIHRYYGAARIDGQLYRIKTTIQEHKNAQNNIYNYKVTEVELLKSGSSTSDALSNSTSISAAKLLKGVEKSYDKGKKLLDESENTPFLYREVKKGDNTLVGIHNVSEEKLSRAINLGGLANPSMAVINLENGIHENFGDISFIASPSLIEKSSGKNAGTWTADAYTPRYPSITYELPKSGAKKLKDLSELIGNEQLANDIYYGAQQKAEEGMVSFYESQYAKMLYLAEKSQIEFVDYKAKSGIDIAANADLAHIDWMMYSRDLTDVQKARVESMYADFTNAKNADFIKRHNAEDTNKLKKILNSSFYNKDGSIDIGNGNFRNFLRSIATDIARLGKIDLNATVDQNIQGAKLRDYESKEYAEYREWAKALYGNLDVAEKLFNGFTPSGNRRYLPNTLENASKLMKKEGRAGTESMFGSSMGAIRARLTPILKNTKQIKANKDRLVNKEAFEEAKNIAEEAYYKVGNYFSDGSKYDFGQYDRLAEAIVYSDIQAYVKREYDIDITDEQLKEIEEFKSNLLALPTEYFETKFERPVYINEFAGAVIPADTSDDIKTYLSSIGLPFAEYSDEDRASVTNEFLEELNEENPILFRVAEKKDAENCKDEVDGKVLFHKGGKKKSNSTDEVADNDSLNSDTVPGKPSSRNVRKPEGASNPRAINPYDTAKLSKNSEESKISKERRKKLNRVVAQIGNKIGMRKSEISLSYYKSVDVLGKKITLRVSNHRANGNNFNHDKSDENISIVITNLAKDKGKIGNVDYDEYIFAPEVFDNDML